MEHSLKRNLVKWGSKGKFHNEPLKFRKISELSDSHLLHIIQWIKDRLIIYDLETLNLMLKEQEYRTKHYIFVPDYK